MEVQTQGSGAAVAAPAPVVVTPATPAPDAAPPPTEAPKAEEPKQPEIDFSSRFAALTRKERMVLERERQFKAKEAQAKADPIWKEFETFRDVKGNPRQHGIKGLELLGLSYKDITDIVLNDGKVPVEKQVEELREQLKAKDVAEAKAKADAEAARVAETEAQAIDAFKGQIKAHVESQGDTYELIREQKAYDLVLEVSEEYWKKTGLVPDIKDASDHVEKYLEEQGRKLLALKRFQAKEEAVEAPPSTSPGVKSTSTAPKTLSNKDTAAAMPASPGIDMSLLDPEKRRAWTAQKLRAAWQQQK